MKDNEILETLERILEVQHLMDKQQLENAAKLAALSHYILEDSAKRKGTDYEETRKVFDDLEKRYFDGLSAERYYPTHKG
mgnify:CR=1 FL=1